MYTISVMPGVLFFKQLFQMQGARNRITTVFFLLLLFVLGCSPGGRYPIESKQQALEIAEKTWLKQYGNKIYQKKPFVATLRDSIWIVEGTVPHHMLGGAPYIEINQKTGQILKVAFYK